MIYQYTWSKVMDGTKERTSRIVKSGDTELVKPLPTDKVFIEGNEAFLYHPVGENREITAVERDGRKLYYVGQTHAVQSGRGKHAIWWRVLNGKMEFWHDQYSPSSPIPLPCDQKNWYQARNRIVKIERQDVRQISEEDAVREGFIDRADFWYVWIEMHDKSYLETFRYASDMGYLLEYGFHKRPDERYDAWVLTFEVVK